MRGGLAWRGRICSCALGSDPGAIIAIGAVMMLLSGIYLRGRDIRRDQPRYLGEAEV